MCLKWVDFFFNLNFHSKCLKNMLPSPWMNKFTIFTVGGVVTRWYINSFFTSFHLLSFYLHLTAKTESLTIFIRQRSYYRNIKLYFMYYSVIGCNILWLCSRSRHINTLLTSIFHIINDHLKGILKVGRSTIWMACDTWWVVVGNYLELTFLDQTDLQLTEKTLYKNIPIKVNFKKKLSSFNFIYSDDYVWQMSHCHIVVGWYGVW